MGCELRTKLQTRVNPKLPGLTDSLALHVHLAPAPLVVPGPDEGPQLLEEGSESGFLFHQVQTVFRH